MIQRMKAGEERIERTIFLTAIEAGQLAFVIK